VPSRSNKQKNLFKKLCSMTKKAGFGSISHWHGSASRSTPKCHGFATLASGFEGYNYILLFRILYCARSGGVYACQRLVLGHHWPVASHQLAVLSRVWLLADRLVHSLAAIHSQLVVIAARLPAAAGDAAQLLSSQQLQFMAETCASNNIIGAFTS
jgi:hypothetical protein